jgi:hypothetical protein
MFCKKTMNLASNIQDLSIVLAVRNLNPTILTPDFLGGSGVIPTDWQLASQPSITTRSSQIAFTNGVQIEAQPGTVNFTEGLTNREPQSLHIPDLVRRFTAALPNLNYTAIGINPRSLVNFDDEAATARYITETILSAGSWQEFGTSPMQSNVNLAYTLERCQFRLNINEAKLKVGQEEPVPAIFFAGNFSYNLPGESPEAHLQALNGVIDKWEEDLVTYRDLIDNHFLAGMKGETVSVFPAPTL